MSQQEKADMYVTLPAPGRMRSALSEIQTTHCKSTEENFTEETMQGFQQKLAFELHLSDGQNIMRKLLKGTESRLSA